MADRRKYLNFIDFFQIENPDWKNVNWKFGGYGYLWSAEANEIWVKLKIEV
jgi:hypothetical protein